MRLTTENLSLLGAVGVTALLPQLISVGIVATKADVEAVRRENVETRLMISETYTTRNETRQLIDELKQALNDLRKDIRAR